jgi:hypothetical protein
MSAYIINVQRSPIDSQGSVTAQSPATRPGFVVSQYSSRVAAREHPSRDHEDCGVAALASRDRTNAFAPMTLVTQNARALKNFD